MIESETPFEGGAGASAELGAGGTGISDGCVPGIIQRELGPETQDASISSYPERQTVNYGDHSRFDATAWTKNYVGQTFRGLLEFSLPELDADAVVMDVTLSLFPTLYRDTLRTGGGHHPMTASNASKLLPITQSWEEHTVTWANQPATTEDGAIELDASASFDQVYVVDLSSWARSVYEGELENHGFLFRLADERTYASLYFNSSDADPDIAQRPVLTVHYDCRN